jgi:hypothetical protein
VIDAVARRKIDPQDKARLTWTTAALLTTNFMSGPLTAALLGGSALAHGQISKRTSASLNRKLRYLTVAFAAAATVLTNARIAGEPKEQYVAAIQQMRNDEKVRNIALEKERKIALEKETRETAERLAKETARLAKEEETRKRKESDQKTALLYRFKEEEEKQLISAFDKMSSDLPVVKNITALLIQNNLCAAATCVTGSSVSSGLGYIRETPEGIYIPKAQKTFKTRPIKFSDQSILEIELTAGIVERPGQLQETLRKGSLRVDYDLRFNYKLSPDAGVVKIRNKEIDSKAKSVILGMLWSLGVKEETFYACETTIPISQLIISERHTFQINENVTVDCENVPFAPFETVKRSGAYVYYIKDPKNPKPASSSYQVHVTNGRWRTAASPR